MKVMSSCLEDGPRLSWLAFVDMIDLIAVHEFTAV